MLMKELSHESISPVPPTGKIKIATCLLFALSALPVYAGGAIIPFTQKSVVSEAAAEAFDAGTRHLQRGRHTEAIEAFKRATALQPDFFEANYLLGYTYKKLGRYTEAVEPLSTATRLRQDSASAYYALGEVYFRLVNYELAIPALKRAIALKVKEPQVYSHLGYASYKLGRWEEAVSAYKEVVKRSKDNTGWERRLIGWFNLYLSRGEEAASQAISNLKKDGWQGKTAFYDVLMAYLGYVQAGRPADARKFLDEASAKIVNKDWPYPLIQYLRGEIAADKLLEIVGGGMPSPIAIDNGRMIVARTFIGMELSLAGRKSEALPHLRWVRDVGKKELAEYEYLLAISELSRIENR